MYFNHFLIACLRGEHGRIPLPLGEAQQHLNQIMCLGILFCLARAGELSSGVKGPGLSLVIIDQPGHWFSAGVRIWFSAIESRTTRAIPVVLGSFQDSIH